MSSPAVAAWSSILRTHAIVVPRLERAVRSAADISLTAYDVLLELHSAGGHLTMGDLGDRVVLSRSRVSRVVDELENDGLVTRENNDADRRSTFAVLTSEGRARFLRAAKAYVPAIEREFVPVNDADLLRIADGLAVIISSAADETVPARPSGRESDPA